MSVTTIPNPVQANRNRVTLILLSIVFVGVVAVVATALILGFQSGQWQYFVLTGAGVFLSLAFGVTFLLTRRGLFRWAAGIVIGGLIVAISLAAGIFAGLGVLLTLMVIFLGMFFAIQLLSGRDFLWGVSAAVVGGFMVTLVDLFAGQFQLDVPAIQTAITIASAAINISFIVLLLIQFRTYPISSKLLATYLIVALLPAGILTILLTNSSRQALTAETNVALLGTAGQTASQIDNFITTNLDIIRSEAQIYVFARHLQLTPAERAEGDENLNSAAINNLLGKLLRRDPLNIASYALLDSRGRAVADTFQADIDTNKSDRDYFRAVIETGLPYASPVRFSQTTGESSIYFSAPVRDDAGKIIGVLRVRYKAAVLQQIMVSANELAGEQSFGILLDENRIRLAHGTQPDLIFKSASPLDAQTIADLKTAGRLPDLPAEQLSTDLPDFENGLHEADVQPVFSADVGDVTGGRSVVAVAALTSQPWTVAYTQPEAILYAPIVAQDQSSSVVLLIITAFVAGFALLITQQFNRPIANLAQTAQQIAAGDLSIQTTVDTSDEIGDLAMTFNSMTAQLRNLIGSLEGRVAARTQDLATVAEVGTATSTILEPVELLQAVVDLTKERFNLYHSHIYLLDEAGENLVLAAGAGEPGRIMAAEKRSIPLSREQSLVARAARERKGVTVNNVTLEPDFLPNPLLPNTRSELAVPMIVGSTLIGVFDIQSDEIGRFAESDINIQTTLAAQVATSIQNARSFEESKSRADLESMVNAIGQKIQRSASVEDTLQIAIRELGTALGASRVSANIQAARIGNITGEN